MSDGNLFIVSAPSGAGKTSLVTALSTCVEGLTVSVSHTTRLRRPGEDNGKDYFFIDSDMFEKMIIKQEFLEYAHVFGHSYGTAKESVTRKLNSGLDVILEIDWQGARQIRQILPGAISVFILPPCLLELEKRLKGRGQDSDTIICSRMSAALLEIGHYNEYEFLIVNDNFERALDQLKNIVMASRNKLERQITRLKPLLDEFLIHRE